MFVPVAIAEVAGNVLEILHALPRGDLLPRDPDDELGAFGLAARVEELELGEGGGKRKKGEHSVLRMHTGLGVRAKDFKKQEKRIQLSAVQRIGAGEREAPGCQVCMLTGKTSLLSSLPDSRKPR